MLLEKMPKADVLGLIWRFAADLSAAK